MALDFEGNLIVLSLVVTVVLQYSCFAIAYMCQFDLITDFAGAINYVLIAYLVFGLNAMYEAHRIAIYTMLCLSRVELGLFLLYRVLTRGSDSRFEKIRTSFKRFFIFWTIQIIWVFGVSFNALFVLGDDYNPATHAYTIVGIVVYGVGLILQVVADFQKYRFRANPNNNGIPFTSGIWKYSRHPNYFGEILIWLGIFIVSLPVLFNSWSRWGYITVISPLLTYIILCFISGIPFAEGKYLERYYANPSTRDIISKYQASTSPLLPFPPSWYYGLPVTVKMIFFHDLPWYHWKFEMKPGISGPGQNHKYTRESSVPTLEKSDDSTKDGMNKVFV